jgi:hypothetical protein
MAAGPPPDDCRDAVQRSGAGLSTRQRRAIFPVADAAVSRRRPRAPWPVAVSRPGRHRPVCDRTPVRGQARARGLRAVLLSAGAAGRRAGGRRRRRPGLRGAVHRRAGARSPRPRPTRRATGRCGSEPRAVSRQQVLALVYVGVLLVLPLLRASSEGAVGDPRVAVFALPWVPGTGSSQAARSIRPH